MLRFSLCQRNKARGIMTWYARIFDTETKEIRYESLSTTKKTEASGILSAKIQDGAFEKKDRSSITLKKALDMYMASLENKGVKPDSLDSVSCTFRCISALFDVPVASITKKMLLETFLENIGSLSASSHNLRRTCIKSAFKYFVNVLEIIPSNTAEVLPSRKNNTKERDFWTLEQIDRILDCATTPSRRLLWSLMAFAGMRIHEALAFKKEDVRDGYIYLVGKGNKPAKIPVSNRLARELERCGWEWDFSGFGSGSKVLSKVAARAIPEGFHGTAYNHRFRHSFASNLIRGGADVKSVQKLMRHSNIQTTLNIYSHLMDKDLGDAIEKMFK